MKQPKIEQLSSKAGKTIEVQGWAETIRKQSKLVFIILRDITGKIQIVATEKDKAVFKTAKSVTPESVLKVSGTVVKQSQAFSGVEIRAKQVTILSQAQALPIPVVEKGTDIIDLPTRLDWRWIDLRKPKNLLLFRIYTEMMQYMREFFKERKFIEAATPKLMASPSESKAELFKLDYFGRPAYLSQSGQFFKQMAMASGFERFYTFADTYRADPSSTVWHTTQFVTLDVEISFIENETDVYDLEEELLTSCISRLEKEYGKQIEGVYGIKIHPPTKPFLRIPMKEAKRIVRAMESTNETPDLTTPEEKLIGAWAMKEHGNEFVFVTDFPWSARPFYHMKKSATTTRSADLIYKGRELSTDAQREHRYDTLIAQAKEKGLNPKELSHYTQFFKFGCPPHGGFGFGYERFLKQLLGLANIREAIFLPRDIKRLAP